MKTCLLCSFVSSFLPALEQKQMFFFVASQNDAKSEKIGVIIYAAKGFCIGGSWESVNQTLSVLAL